MRRAARLVVLAGALFALGHALAAPGPVSACSCVERRPLAEYAARGSVILAGRVVDQDQRGLRVAVERWFAGPLAAPVAWIAGEFGNSGICGVGTAPPVGSSWIWVASRAKPADDLLISICAPIADLSTPDGQALLAEAVGVFGPSLVNGGRADPTASAGMGTPDDENPIDPALLVGSGGVLLTGVLLLGAAILVARRRPA